MCVGAIAMPGTAVVEEADADKEADEDDEADEDEEEDEDEEWAEEDEAASGVRGFRAAAAVGVGRGGPVQWTSHGWLATSRSVGLLDASS